MRIWNGRENDHGSVHAVGNGKLIAYEKGPDITQIFGPPYSAKNFGSIYLEEQTYCQSTREKGTAIWRHSVGQEGAAGEFLDFSGEGAQFVRVVDAREPLRFTFDTKLEWTRLHTFKNEAFSDSLFIRLPRYGYIFGKVNSPNEQCMLLVVKGQTHLSVEDEKIIIHCGVGHSELFFCAGGDFPTCMRMVNQITDCSAQELLNHQREVWQTLTNRLRPVTDSIPDIPLKERILDAIESTAVIIKTQQSDEGGVLAGEYYHLAYVRDGYGVSRCLLRLGLYEEARRLLEYYLQTFLRNGAVHNAQAMGVDGFHIHENDSTEIPGYLVMQAMDYYESTQDEQMLRRLLPLLKWAVEEQVAQLHKNMMPFNGDETYIAGGIYPRSGIDHGSAEATLIFAHTARLLDWLEARNLDVPWAAHKRGLVNAVRAEYQKNFILDGQLMTNNPARFDPDILPEYRIGGCTHQGCSEFYGWGIKNAQGAFVCPECLEHNSTPDMSLYQVRSTALQPFYMKSDLVPEEVIRPLIEQLAEEFIRKGNFSTRADSNKTVGYDYGLLLHNAVKMGLPSAAKLAELMLDKLDDTDAWVEYYLDGVPHNCRYRPWESAINLDALLLYAESCK